jgi:glycosyltransferase involved in cell wall biosynthesis
MATRLLPAGSWKFLGFLAKPALAEEMRSASGFVFPSEFETFGCVLMEALACGCPALTTAVGGIPSVADGSRALIVPVGDISAIAAGMRVLLDGTHGFDMSAVAADTHALFSRPAVGARLHAIYREVVSEHRLGQSGSMADHVALSDAPGDASSRELVTGVPRRAWWLRGIGRWRSR